jgi:hypothetical protein
MGQLLPDERWDIRFEFLDEDSRIITFAARGESSRTRLANLAHELAEIAPLEAFQ